MIGFARFGRAPARFDEGELSLLNQKILHHTPYVAVADRLPPAINEARWNAIRPNLMTVAEAADWLPVFDGPFAPPPPADAGHRAGLDRKGAAQGKSVSVRVDLGGPRPIQKKQPTTT